MILAHDALVQSYLLSSCRSSPLLSSNVITYCSGSRLITLYPVYHTERSAGTWELADSLKYGTHIRPDQVSDSKSPADQVAISYSQAVSSVHRETLCCGGRLTEAGIQLHTATAF